MRVLNNKDFEDARCFHTLISISHFFIDKKIHVKDVKIQADFQGNLFYDYKENGDTHLKPLGITVPELKAVPEFGGDNG